MLLKKVFLFQAGNTTNWIFRLISSNSNCFCCHLAFIATDVDTKAIWLRINNLKCFSSIRFERNGVFEQWTRTAHIVTGEKCCKYFLNFFFLFHLISSLFSDLHETVWFVAKQNQGKMKGIEEPDWVQNWQKNLTLLWMCPWLSSSIGCAKNNEQTN